MITFSSDFGSPYPAAMRGVILRRSDARLIDVSHEFPRGDVRATAFWLRFVLPEFPPATHLVVIDPGVGTDREAIVVRAGDHLLVGPDNGVLLPAARALAGDGQRGHGACTEDLNVFRIDAEDPDSTTFHGRDVFAPAAVDAHEAGVDDLDSVDRFVPTDEVVDLDLPEATVDGDQARGEVLVVDDFGNTITNIPGEFLAGVDTVRVNDERVSVGETFASVPAGDQLVTVGSHGNVECDVNQGRGDEAFGLEPGDEVVIEAGD